MSAQTWSSESYEKNARFVSDYGAVLLDLLGPRAGERILDVGCGDGVLTERIARTGAHVVGIDSSDAFVAAARNRGLDARHVDAHSLPFLNEFDAAFSNAALHWMTRPDEVLAGIARALKQGGRFVAEFGGHTNIAAITTALRALMKRRGYTYPEIWYFPSPADYSSKLEAHGFQVDSIDLIPRPTPLPTGMSGWLATFAQPMLGSVPDEVRQEVVDEVVALLRPALCDSLGNWTADYVRLRFVALKG